MSGRIQLAQPHKKFGYWYYIRNVPREFQSLDKRGQVMISTGIRVADDPLAMKATPVVRDMDAETFKFWKARQSGDTAEAEFKYKKAINWTQSQGYAPHAKSAFDQLSADEVLQRLKVMKDRGTIEDDTEASALFGTHESPQNPVSSLLTEYEQIQATQNAKKSEKQLHRWRLVRQTALDSFLAVIGKNRSLESLTRQDSIDYHKAIAARVKAGEIGIDAANKYLMRVATMYRAFNKYHQLGLKDHFTQLNFGKAPKNPRKPYDPKFIQDRLLAEGALAGLNDEARRIVYLMVETGVRPSEACALSENTIVLNHDIPHIRVIEEGREVKSENAIREIPLIGVALQAMKLQPHGFPRYKDNANSLSAAVNKFLEENGLRPHPKHSLYSLRHSFKDRLRHSHATQELMDELMGHETDGVRADYGDGYLLDYKRDFLLKTAYLEPLTL